MNHQTTPRTKRTVHPHPPTEHPSYGHSSLGATIRFIIPLFFVLSTTTSASGVWHVGKYLVPRDLAPHWATPGNDHRRFQPGQMFRRFGDLRHAGPTHFTFCVIPGRVCLPLRHIVSY